MILDTVEDFLRLKGTIPILLLMEEERTVYANRLIKKSALEFETVRAGLEYLEGRGLIRKIETPGAQIRLKYELTKNGHVAARCLRDCFESISKLLG